MSRRYGRIDRSKELLELEADKLLSGELKNKKSNKAKTSGILSDSQLARRQRREVPFTDLSLKDKLRLGITLEGGDQDQ